MIYQQVANTFSTLLSVPVGFTYVFPQNYENQIDNQLVSTWGGVLLRMESVSGRLCWFLGSGCQFVGGEWTVSQSDS